uniref:Uncharacterized protein n=1 Tax=Anguilla anguilla TaxID=7936 RepID=A0A0E9QI23_ANGAN
MPAVMFAGDLL